MNNNFDADTVIIDFTNNNNNNNNNNLNSFITIDPTNINQSRFGDERDRYTDIDKFQKYVQTKIFPNFKSTEDYKINDLSVNPIQILDAITKSQMQNVVFKFADDIAGALGFKTINVFKSDRYDTIKKAVDNLSKLDPNKYIKGTSMIINNNIPNVGGNGQFFEEEEEEEGEESAESSTTIIEESEKKILPKGKGKGKKKEQEKTIKTIFTTNQNKKIKIFDNNSTNIGSRFNQNNTKLLSTIKLRNISPRIRQDLDEIDKVFTLQNSTEYLNNIIFLQNLEGDKSKKQKIFFDYHMEIYEKLNFYFNTRFTSNLSLILDQIKTAIKFNLKIEFKDNKQMFAELIKSDYYNSFVSYCRDYFKLNVFTYNNHHHVYDKKVLINNLKIELLNILSKINNNISNEEPTTIANAQSTEFFNNL